MVLNWTWNPWLLLSLIACVTLIVVAWIYVFYVAPVLDEKKRKEQREREKEDEA